MPTAIAVIGAGYGDEGKGLMTDAFSAVTAEDGVVVRFNGGAQAGHTITLADGRRHVFHHIGSGTFTGASSFLSRFFVANPILFCEEFENLTRLGLHPRISIDPMAHVTTPYDMMINQIAEKSRGPDRHGSCGLGFGETLERGLYPKYALTIKMLENQSVLRDHLLRLRKDWVPLRLSALGIQNLTVEDHALISSDAILDQWLNDVTSFLKNVTILDCSHLRHVDKIFFEGAQGLMLDQDHGVFPYVTRSNTGLKNVLSLASDLALQKIEVVYVTRAYTTRHGAGPLDHELSKSHFPDVVDMTNINNPWQGHLRFGILDIDILQKTIRNDLAYNSRNNIKIQHGIAVTCLDQIGPNASLIINGTKQQTSPEELAKIAAQAIETDLLWMSFGPSRETIVADHTIRFMS